MNYRRSTFGLAFPGKSVGKYRMAAKTWLGAFLIGIELLLLLLIGAWLLRSFSPGVHAFTFSVVERPAATELATSLLRAWDSERQLRAQLAALQDDLTKKSADCAAAPALPADRWNRKDLDLLAGCWLLGHEVGAVRGDLGRPEREENCTTRTGRICFDGKGSGQREQIMDCPISGRSTCKAPISVKFNDDGTLGTTQPRVECEGPPTFWLPYSLRCERRDDTTAICHSNGFPGYPPREYEFRREP